MKRTAMLVATLLWATTSMAQAQDKTQPQPSSTSETFGDWVIHCVTPPAGGKPGAAAPKTQCEIVQSIQATVNGKPNQTIARVAIGRLPDDPALIMTAMLPVNVRIPGMAHISGDGKSGSDEKIGADLALRRCLPMGCFADVRPDQAFLSKLGTGDQLKGELRFQDANGQLIKIPLSWKGLPDALKAYSSK